MGPEGSINQWSVEPEGSIIQPIGVGDLKEASIIQ